MRWRVMATVGAVVLLAMVGVFGSGPAARANPPLPIVRIDTINGLLLGASADGGYALLNDPGQNDYYTVDTETAVAEPLDMTIAALSSYVSEDGVVYTVSGGVISREAIGGDPETIDVDLGLNWIATNVTAVDASGERAVVVASNGVLAKVRTFLVELTSETAITDTDDGLTQGGNNSDLGWFLADGSVVIMQYALVGQSGPTNYLVWDADVTAATTIAPPAEHEATSGGWFIDWAAEYAWFRTDDGGLVGGVGAGATRLYRRVLSSSATVVAPAGVTVASSMTPMPNGELLLAIDAPSGGTDHPQLFSWDGLGPTLLQLTVGVGNTEPNGPVTTYVGPMAGEKITFTTFSTNLRSDTGSSPPNGFLLQIDPSAEPEPPLTTTTTSTTTTTLAEPAEPVEPVDASDPAAPVEASTSYCVPAVGARPGEFVGANITPVDAATNGNGALHSSDDDAPPTANVNFRPGSVDPNVALAEVGGDGRVCFTNSRHGPVDVVIDSLFVAAMGVFELPTTGGAVRVADTRTGLGGTTVDPLNSLCVDVPGGSPGDIAGINITPINAATSGNGALHSSDDDPPGTANVNFGVGTVDPNLAFARIGADGEVCFTNSRHGPVDVIMDALVIGSSTPFADASDDGAVRLVDSRIGLGASRFDASQTQCFDAAGAVANEWVALNITPIGAITNGNGAVHSSDDPAPDTANVNFREGSIDPNLALVETGADGEICFTNSRNGPVDVVIDVLFVASASALGAPTEDGAYRLADTRVGRHAPA